MGGHREVLASHTAGLVRCCIVAGTTVASVTATGCDGSVADPNFNGVRIGEITYQVKSFAVAESFPVQIGVTVEIVNESASPQSVTFPDGCVVLMRAYNGGSEPVWDMAGVVACTQALVQVDLTPGETEEFQTGLVSTSTILGDSLPNGEYRITVYLRPSQDVELDAGPVDLGKL